jgi:ubiquinone/menaquinone biosynthesis C-methylase UbiE
MIDASTFIATSGEGYELQMGRWSRRLSPMLIDFAGLTRAKEVLDVGCGTGSLSFCLVQNPQITNVLGLDFSPAYIEHASRKNLDTRLAFQLGDARELPFSDNSFDHSLSMLTLQFIPQADLAVREMRRVTRRGGTVAATTWDTRGGFVAFRMVFDAAAILDRSANELRGRAYTRPMSRPGELARAWCNAGFTDVTQDMLTIRMEFSSFADFWAPAEGQDGPVAQYVATLDVEAKTTLRHAVRMAYLDGEQDGIRSYAATAWAVKGKVP